MLAHALRFTEAEGTMLRMIKKLIFFRVGQRASRTVARGLGFHRASRLIGLVGGIRSMRRH